MTYSVKVWWITNWKQVKKIYSSFSAILTWKKMCWWCWRRYCEHRIIVVIIIWENVQKISELKYISVFDKKKIFVNICELKEVTEYWNWKKTKKRQENNRRHLRNL